MYKKFKKELIKQCREPLFKYGFKYLDKEEIFIGYNKDIIFEISTNESICGTISIIYYFPHLNNKLIIPFNYSEEIDSFFLGISDTKWSFNNTHKRLYRNTKERNIMIDSYIKDIKYIFKYYVPQIISKIINNFDVNNYIYSAYTDEFYRYIEYHNIKRKSQIYIEAEFFDKNRDESEWTKKDDDIINKLNKLQMEEILPFKTFKKERLFNIQNNKETYKNIILKFFGKDFKVIKINKNIKSIKLNDFLYETVYGQKIIKTLYNFGYIKKSIKERENNIITYKTKKGLFVDIILEDDIFLKFKVGEEKILAFYEGVTFNFGWFVGDSRDIEKNINKAILVLKNNLV